MRDIVFEEVGMENYGPYIDPMIHTFVNNTVTLMTGPNGIGKTMSLDAIPFTLYGITSKGAKGDDVVNNTVGKNCKTWVKFKINDDQYLITRYVKYTKLGNTVILNKNKVDIKSGQREVLPEIERLICPSKSFMNTLMFGQKVKDFFTDLIDSDKKEIFRKILLLGQYLIFYKETDTRLKKVKNEIDELANKIKINQGILDDVVEQIDILTSLKKKFYADKKEIISQLKKDLEDNKRLSDNWKKELCKLEQTEYGLETLKDDFAKLNTNLESFNSKHQLVLNDLNGKMSKKKYELKSSSEEAKTKVRDITKISTNSLTSVIETTRIKLQNTINEHSQKIHKFDVIINSLNSDNRSIESNISEIELNVFKNKVSTCPTCDQEVNDDTRKLLLIKIDKYQVKIEDNNQHIVSTKDEIEVLKKSHSVTINQLNDLIKTSQDSITKLTQNENDEYKNIDSRLKQTFEKVDEIAKEQTKKLEEKSVQEKADLLEEHNELSETIVKAEAHQLKIDKVNETIQNLSGDHSTIERNIKIEESKEYDADQLLKYDQRKIDLELEIKQHNNETKVLNKRKKILEFWKIGFSSSGIPSMLIDEAIPFMNLKVSKYLDMLTNGRYIVSFDTLAETKAGEFRDKISVRVLDTHTQANLRVQLSGGQTRIIDIATILTLGELQANMQDMKINILLFDEIFDALDDENIGYVAKVLNKLKVGKSIYIIAHQHSDVVEADQRLELC